MKRDLNLVREILRYVETEGSPGKLLGPPKLDGYTIEEIRYHVALLDDAGLLMADFYPGGFDISSSLPWVGHEFLDLAESDAVWQEAKRAIAEKGITVTLEILTEYLKKLTKERLMCN